MLLTGLAVAVADWCRRHGRGVAGDGRPRLRGAAGCGGSRPRGGVCGRSICRGRWAGSPACYPVRLDAVGARRLRRRWRAARRWAALKRIKEQLRALPQRGLGYGLLRYLNGATARQLAGFAAPQICLQLPGPVCGGRAGGLGWGERAATAWRRGSRDAAVACALRSMRITLDGAGRPAACGELDVGAGAACARPRCAILRRAGFGALEALVRMPRSRAPAAAARAICRWLSCRRPRSSGWSGAIREIEDILPLSPLQEGLLFHALYDARAPDVYTVQLDLELAGRSTGARLEAAAAGAWWRGTRACGRASGMTGWSASGAGDRAAGGGAVAADRSVGAGEAERAAAAGELVAQDRAERFDLARAPLLRFALIRLAADRHRLVLSSHHLLDGRLVGAGAGAGAVGALCGGERRRCRG